MEDLVGDGVMVISIINERDVGLSSGSMRLNVNFGRGELEIRSAPSRKCNPTDMPSTHGRQISFLFVILLTAVCSFKFPGQHEDTREALDRVVASYQEDICQIKCDEPSIFVECTACSDDNLVQFGEPPCCRKPTIAFWISVSVLAISLLLCAVACCMLFCQCCKICCSDNEPHYHPARVHAAPPPPGTLYPPVTQPKVIFVPCTNLKPFVTTDNPPPQTATYRKNAEAVVFVTRY